jgi:transglutaminase-like putative cysteine protease
MPAGISRRTVTSIDDLILLNREHPIVKPVAEAKIPQPLVPSAPARVLPIVLRTPQIDRQSEILPNFSTSPSPIEESLLLRILVLGIFAISVISTDLAAGTHYSWVSIPCATVGAAWSWHRRHYAKHWLNIAVSIASLAILIGLIVPILFRDMQIGMANYAAGLDLVAPQLKTSMSIGLALGMLMVGLQIGLSFNLYSRKVLGYCLLISVVLMGVTASLSRNISFLILLCGFVAIGIPGLMLDYRSRLALKPIGIQSRITAKQLPYQYLPWKYLSQLAAISIGLGLMLAVFLPNFHLPDLSFKPSGLDNLQTLAQKYHNSQPAPQSPSAQDSSSQQPQLSAREMASKLLGQPGNNNYPDTIKQDHLQVPPEIASQLQQFTQQILATSPQPLNSDYDRAAYLGEYLKQHHQSDPQQLDPAKLPSVDTKLVQQLIVKCPPELKDCQLTGNKQDVSVVYTSMLRSIGIPARLKTGDKLAEFDPHTQMYQRPPADAQSQTEVYFPNWGWMGLDATPVGEASLEENQPLLNPDPRQLAQLQQQSQNLPPSAQPAPTPTPQSSPANSTPQPSPGNSTPQTAPDNPASSPNRSTPTDPQSPFELPKWEPDPVILRIIVAVIAICGGMAWYLRYQRQQQQQLAHLPPVEQIYRSMLANLSKQGLSKRPAQTQLEYASSASKIYHPQIAKVVWEISQLYTAWRYGNQKIDVKQLAKKLQYLQQLQQLAAQRQRQQWVANLKSQWGFK